MAPYKIEISSPFRGFSLYTLTLMGEVMAGDSVVEFMKYKREAGAKDMLDSVVVDTKGGDALTLYIYNTRVASRYRDNRGGRAL